MLTSLQGRPRSQYIPSFSALTHWILRSISPTGNSPSTPRPISTQQTAVPCIPSHRLVLPMTVSFTTTTSSTPFLNNSAPMINTSGITSCVAFIVDSCICKSRIAALSSTTLVFIIMTWAHFILGARFPSRVLSATCAILRHLCSTAMTFDWRSNAYFRVTHAMKISIALSMVLGMMLGIGVGLISGFEPAVVIGVSASMAMGCVFVMSFAVLHGVNALRAAAFALFVSFCLPFGFGFGFGLGILIGIMFGLEDPVDVREKTADFVHNFPDFIKVAAAFTLEIL